jgi:DNA-binding transcriptional LysR family regulator
VNLRQLEVFHAIMRTGSVTGAARFLNVTQPAVSNVLKHTEQQLCFRLFERIGGRLQPTPEATQLLSDVNEIFARIGTFRRTVLDMRDGRSGRVVVAASPTLVNAFLPQAIAAFREENPAVRITIQSLPTSLAIERVARREVDLGLVYAPVTDGAVEVEPFIATEVVCVVPRRHPLARKRRIGARDLEGRPLISLGATMRIGTLIDEGFRRAGVPVPEVGVEASSSLAACLMVSAGAGIGLVDRATSLSGKFGDLAFRPLDPTIRVDVQIIYPRDRPRSRAAGRLAEQLHRIGGRGLP